jgi:DNA mismatch endonuclease (patch repair protein)
VPDIVDRATRSRMMAGIRGRNTRPELAVRSYLHRAGLRFRVHVGSLPGHPDIVLPRFRTVVFVHGCFWHRHPGCRFAYRPKSNTEFWESKLEGNAARDQIVVQSLRDLGWMVHVVWECQVEDAQVLDGLASAIRGT